MEIKLADLILVRGDGPISHAIEEITDSPYSHTAGYVKENELIEAQGFRHTGYQGLDFYAGMADVFTCDSATDEQRRMMARLAEREVGGHYSFLLLVWEFVRYTTGILLPYDPGPNRICSTLWAAVYRSVGIDLCPGMRHPSPGDVAASKRLRKIGSI